MKLWSSQPAFVFPLFILVMVKLHGARHPLIVSWILFLQIIIFWIHICFSLWKSLVVHFMVAHWTYAQSGVHVRNSDQDKQHLVRWGSTECTPAHHFDRSRFSEGFSVSCSYLTTITLGVLSQKWSLFKSGSSSNFLASLIHKCLEREECSL